MWFFIHKGKKTKGVRNTREAEGILCGVMKIKNPIFMNSGSMRTSTWSSIRKILNFSPFKIAFCVILHKTRVVITHPVPNAVGNYKLHV